MQKRSNPFATRTNPFQETKEVVKEEPKKQPTKEELLDRTMIFDGAQKKNLKEVVENLEKEYEQINLINWKECKELMENIKEA